MIISEVPLSVLNRALDLFGEPRETDRQAAMAAIQSAGSRKDVVRDPFMRDPFLRGIEPLARAVAEYMSLSGPWEEEDGEYSGENGYEIRL
jgi:hypothetical protein